MKSFKCLTYFIVIALTNANEEITVDLSQGTLKGLKTTTVLSGKPYCSFKGIPYAKPPIGQHKFDPPVAPDPWIGVLDATNHRQTCVFFCMMKQGIVGDEDCLYLNVYTPDVNKDAKRAVMIFIHPGGFNAGSGDDDVYGPDFLIEQDVVVVTFNSRLGAPGFLSTGDANAPGNAGMKDQVMVLKWVKENIKNFGGCPNRVTIFGESSGSASVQFHMMSPMSRGLFKRAIMQSGSALNPFALIYNPKDMAFKLGETLGIKTTDTKELVDKLRELSVQDIVTASQEVAKTMNHMNGHMGAFTPVVEPDVGQDIFLTNDPWTLVKKDDIADVPLMIGVALDETAFITPMFLPNAEMMDQHFDMFIPDDLNVTDAKRKEMSDMLRKFYFDGKALTADAKAQFTMMTSDIFFDAGILMSSRIIGSRDKSPVYEYLFSHYSPVGIVKNLFKTEEGVSHGDDIGYLFYSNALKNKPETGSPAEKIIKIMTKLWTNFAKEGNPTPNTDEDFTVAWTPIGSDDNYLEINQPLKMEKGLFKERITLWAQLYNDVLGDYAKLFK
ncbi:juvenile hormone esterase-like [Phymastichus coffea]|uniref:juvenile hormone esterase-like n=1 Tax=Phymastichus coffea TaxID=108790 RepID=UPI00273BA385|nr:juvenile hormone esterase-like [Phymastichus coffea]XP_058804193.1 juvenile hormone esterase-like [Phymastichus coffea]